MKEVRRISTLVLSLFCAVQLTYAQSSDMNCKNALYEANTSYENGKFTEAVSRVEGCLAGMGGEERTQALRLLALSYHALKDQENERKYMILMVEDNPVYNDLPHNDPVTFTRTISEVKSTPVLYVGFHAGLNVNTPRIRKSFLALDAAQYYNPSQGYGGGGMVEYALSENLSLAGRVGVMGVTNEHELVSDNWAKTYHERLQMTVVHAGVKYKIPLTEMFTLRPGLRVGTGFMNYSRINIENENLISNTTGIFTKEGLNEHNTTQPYVGGTLSLDTDLGPGIISLTAGHDWYLANTINNEHRLDNQDFIFDAQYIQDDIQFRLMTWSLSYRWPIKYKVSF